MKTNKWKIDLRQEVTNRIIAMLEKGGNSFSKGWSDVGLPKNGLTGQAYSGVNVILLMMAVSDNNFSSNVWMTYNQAVSIGAQVKKGSKSVTCVYFEMKEKKQQEENKKEFFPMCKPFWLFNADQIDGLPETMTEKREVKKWFKKIEEAEEIILNSGVKIKFGGSKAFYRPSSDDIHLPEKESFFSEENYYATALHELTHWTGHESRLNRNFSGRFGSESYAFEELVAELGAAFLVAETGFLNATIENHVGYLESWLKILRNDKTAIFSASKFANQAFDFLKVPATKIIELAA